MILSELKVSRLRPSAGNPFCTSSRSNRRLLPATETSMPTRELHRNFTIMQNKYRQYNVTVVDKAV